MAGYKHKGKDRDALEAPREAQEPNPQEHGTYAGHRRHRRAGEKPCEACRLAYNAHMAARRGGKSTGRKNGAPVCGTLSGYQTHIRLGEETCEPCRKAQNEYRRSRPDKQKLPDGMVTIGEALNELLVDLEQRRDNAEGVAA